MQFLEKFKTVNPLFREAILPGKVICLLVFLLLVENGLALISPWLIGTLSEAFLADPLLGNFDYKKLLFLWLVIIICQNLLSYFNRILITFNSEKIVLKLKTHLYDHIQSLPLSYFIENQRGSILSLISHDTNIIATFATSTLVSIFPSIIVAIGALICLYLLSPPVAVTCSLLLPIFVLVIKLLGRSIGKLSKQLMQEHGKTLAIAEENFGIIPAIKAYNGEKAESERFAKASRNLYTTARNFHQAQARMSPTIRAFGSFVIILVLLTAGKHLSNTPLTAGNLISIFLYGMFLIRPISSLAEAYGQTQRALAASNRLSEVFSATIENPHDGRIVATVKGRIDFDRVTFGFPERDPLYTNLSFSIMPYETIAITGENGAGKSTLAHLLLRLHEPQFGQIKLDGIDIQEISLSSLRSHFALVQQTVLLRNGTVLENLLLAKPDASEDEITEACRQAHAMDFIKQLPGKLDTIIGDQGIKLSGGQQQRLALARALLKKPSILILDEATAMFDPEGEAQFITTNRELLKQHTVIIITHRPASLKLADRVLRLENGQLKSTE